MTRKIKSSADSNFSIQTSRTVKHRASKNIIKKDKKEKKEKINKKKVEEVKVTIFDKR